MVDLEIPSTNLGTTSSCGGLFPKGPLASTARTNEANSRQCRGIFWLQWMSFDIFLSNAGKLLLIQTLKILPVPWRPVTSCLASPYPSSNGWLARLQICIDWDALIFATMCGVDISGSINPSVLETNELERGRFASSNPGRE